MSELETFGIEPMPYQIKEFDKEFTVRTFTELMHQVGCGCSNCLGSTGKTMDVLFFGKNRRPKEKALKLAKNEIIVFQFNKRMDEDLKKL